jgi:hypothetical protein
MSLPRAGSTLLQRVLASHPAISTRSETWILLPAVYALRANGTFAEYSHRTALQAMTAFCEELPGNRQAYLDAVATMAMALYQQVSDADATYFLDKTPRYQLIVDELLEMFPSVTPIVLWRNPLAVVASMLETWSAGRWRPYLHKIDLFEGVERLTAAIDAQPSRFITVRYEDLVAEPSVEVGRLLGALGLEVDPSCVEQFSSVQLRGPVGDKLGVQTYSQVSAQSLDRWKATMASPIRKQWCRRYLSWLGRRRLQLMGYELDQLRAELDAIPSRAAPLPSDVAWSAHGVMWSAFEPQIMRHKLARLPAWRRVMSHS